MIYQGSRFRADKRQPVKDNGTSYWRCTETACSAKLKVFDEKVIKTYGVHLHGDRNKESRNNGQMLPEHKKNDANKSSAIVATNQAIDTLPFIGDSLPDPDELDLAELVRQKELLEAKLRQAEAFDSSNKSKFTSAITTTSTSEEKMSKSVNEEPGDHFKQPKETNGQNDKRKSKRNNSDVSLKPNKKTHTESVELTETSKRPIETSEIKKGSRETSYSPERILEKDERFDRYASERENNGRDTESGESSRRKRDHSRKESRGDDSKDRHRPGDSKKQRRSSEREVRNHHHLHDVDRLEHSDRDRTKDVERDRSSRINRNGRHRRERSTERTSDRRRKDGSKKKSKYKDDDVELNGHKNKNREAEKEKEKERDYESNKDRRIRDEDKDRHRTRSKDTNGKTTDSTKAEEIHEERIEDVEEEDEEQIIERRRRERQELLKRLGAVQDTTRTGEFYYNSN